LLFRIFHAFVGGKAIDLPFVPGARAVLLFLTVVLNIWLCARLYFRDIHAQPSHVYDIARKYVVKNHVIYGIQVCHLFFCTTQLVTAILNSAAGDSTRGRTIRIMGGKHISIDWMVSLSKVLYDVKWLLFMTTLSALGLKVTEIMYAFCIMDVIPQVRHIHYPTLPFPH